MRALLCFTLLVLSPSARGEGPVEDGVEVEAAEVDAEAADVDAEAADAPVTPQTAQLQADWARLEPHLQALGRMPIELRRAELSAAAAGRVARRRERLDGTDRALGATWTDVDRDALWIAILDDACDTLVDGLTERHLPDPPPASKLLFQHVDLPWPFADRQWVIDIRNNPALFAATDGGLWERTWKLVDDPAAVQERVPGDDMPAPDAVWTPVNAGGWLLADAGGGTLVVYHARVDVGGSIPDDLATAYTMSTLKGLLEHVVERARVIPDHYDASHAPIQRADGSVIPPW